MINLPMKMFNQRPRGCNQTFPNRIEAKGPLRKTILSALISRHIAAVRDGENRQMEEVPTSLFQIHLAIIKEVHMWMKSKIRFRFSRSIFQVRA